MLPDLYVSSIFRIFSATQVLQRTREPVRCSLLSSSLRELNLLPHYHLDDPSATAPENYGFDLTENQNRDTVYFKNMFIRNVTATRFLKAYIGDNSFGKISFKGETVAPLGRWAKGDNFTVDGGSQAGFQALAITALDKFDIRAYYFKLKLDFAHDQIHSFEIAKNIL